MPAAERRPHGHARSEDIQGAFGTIREHDVGARFGARARLLTLLAILGPGLIVTVGDNDAGGLSTYAQAGQDYGLTLLWTLVLCIPVLIVNQEMVARLGAVSGVGHARLIRERFGRLWGTVAVSSILTVNFLIIITEFIGVSLSLTYFGVRPEVSVPLAGIGLFAIIATGSYRRWERIMFVFIVVSLLAIPLLVLSHPTGSAVLHGLVVPGAAGGFKPPAVLLTISIVGTTVAPWQLYFQQSNIVDKKITTQVAQLRARRHDHRHVRRDRDGGHDHLGGRRRRRGHAGVGRVHRRAGRRPGAPALRRARGRRDVRHPPAQRLDHRGGDRHARQQLRAGRRVGAAPVAEREGPRREGLLRADRRAHRRRGRHGARDGPARPGHHHARRAGGLRDPAAR